MTAKSSTRVDPLKLVTRLIDCGNVDTVYRDVYLGRGRTLLAEELPVEEFRRSEQQAAELATLAPTIGRAIEKGDWPQVKTLSDRAEALRRAVEGKRGQMETARNVYAVTDVKLDPFSPGLRAFTRLAEKDLLALRTRTVEHLTALALADAPWKSFYDDRRAALRALLLTASQRPETTAASANPREAAERALKSGDMTGLAKLAGALMAAVTPAKRAPGSSRPSARQDPASEKPSADLLTTYTDDTLEGARRLGLAARRLESRVELASLRQYAWNPLLSDESGRIGAKRLPLPAGTPEAFRDRLEMIVIHPLVNSGGARHLPTLVAEDVLVETFPDPKEGEQPPGSELLAALGLPGRRGSRASRSRTPCSLMALACSRKSSASTPGLPSRLRSSGRPSSARRSGGLGAPALLDTLRRLPRHGRRAAAGARRGGRAVRGPVRSARHRPGLRFRPRGGAFRGGAPRADGRLVITEQRAPSRSTPGLERQPDGQTGQIVARRARWPQ